MIPRLLESLQVDVERGVRDTMARMCCTNASLPIEAGTGKTSVRCGSTRSAVGSWARRNDPTGSLGATAGRSTRRSSRYDSPPPPSTKVSRSTRYEHKLHVTLADPRAQQGCEMLPSGPRLAEGPVRASRNGCSARVGHADCSESLA